VIDVRSQPTSRYCPQFNRPALRDALRGRFGYAYMGDSLGGRPEDLSLYDDAGHVLYGPLSRHPSFVAGLEALEKNRDRRRMALMCSEADPLSCHRFLVVTRTLVQRGWNPADILHILGDGSAVAETQLAFQGRLLEDSWRSPLSVLPGRPPGPSSSA
jgi:uncharacterized protein (DUF488 family)